MEETTHVLVGYATAIGSTAGVAERIAARLRDSGCEVDSRPVGPDLEPGRFHAIVLGSVVHNMAWLRPALDCPDRMPATTPTWFFSVGGVEPRGRVTRRLTDLEITRVEQGFPATLRGREHRLFAGVVRMAALALWGRVFWRLIGGRDGDHRDWAAIDRWTSGIAAEIARMRNLPGRGRPDLRVS